MPMSNRKLWLLQRFVVLAGYLVVTLARPTKAETTGDLEEFEAVTASYADNLGKLKTWKGKVL